MKELSAVEVNIYGVLIYNGLVYKKEIHGILCFLNPNKEHKLKDIFFLIK